MSTPIKNRQTTLALYQSVREAYGEWSAKAENGVKKYTDDYIFMKLGERFFRSPRTIENIVYHRVKEEVPVFSQGTLF